MWPSIEARGVIKQSIDLLQKNSDFGAHENNKFDRKECCIRIILLPFHDIDINLFIGVLMRYICSMDGL